MKNGLVSFLLTGATHLRGKADNSQLQRNDMLLCSTALLFIVIPKNPARFMEAPKKAENIEIMGLIHLSISLLSVQQKH